MKLIGTANFKRVDIVKNNAYVYNIAPGKREVELTWTDKDPTQGTSYYYVRGEQEDGELIWVSPMWVTYRRRPAADGYIKCQLPLKRT